MIFDKTGTLTEGRPILVAIKTSGLTETDVLRLAAAVEADSEHPLARAITEGAHERGVEIPARTGFEALPGRGARAVVDGLSVAVGGPGLLTDLDVQAVLDTSEWEQAGQTVLYRRGRRDASLEPSPWRTKFGRSQRKRSPALHELGIGVAMITGDSQAVADAVARRLGLDHVAAQVLPADKAAAVRQFQRDGQKVAFVGDGVNDAPALATADVGIAIGAGTDVAIESAGIVLVRSDPRDVVAAIELSRATYRKELQNLVWATGYNLVAIPLAMGVLSPWGIDLPMAVGAIAMSLSTIIVAANAQLLRRVRLRPRELSRPAAPAAAVA